MVLQAFELPAISMRLLARSLSVLQPIEILVLGNSTTQASRQTFHHDSALMRLTSMRSMVSGGLDPGLVEVGSVLGGVDEAGGCLASVPGPGREGFFWQAPMAPAKQSTTTVAPI